MITGGVDRVVGKSFTHVFVYEVGFVGAVGGGGFIEGWGHIDDDLIPGYYGA